MIIVHTNPAVLITGSSKGIGRAAALAFAQLGYQVFLNGRSAEALAELRAQIQDRFHVPCYAVASDVSDYRSMEEAFLGEIYTRVPRLHVLVNNAGVSYTGLLQDMPEEAWDRVMAVNLKSVYICSKLAVGPMVRAHEGVILNVSSIWGVRGASCEVAYSASKGAVNAFTQGLARELAPSGIRVNAAAFGCIDTAMNRGLTQDDRRDLEDSIGAGRFGTPEEAASLLTYLASPDSSYINGQIITMDGCFNCSLRLQLQFKAAAAGTAAAASSPSLPPRTRTHPALRES